MCSTAKKTAEDFNKPDSAMKLLYNDCLSLANGIKDYVPGSNELNIENFNISDPNFPRLYSILIGCKPTAETYTRHKVCSITHSPDC